MSIIDKVLEAVTPPEREADRAEARSTARQAARPGDWLSHALDHHDQIRAAFEEGLSASPSGRIQAMRRLAAVLNGHSLAEELVLYPALAKSGEKGHAAKAYLEQSTAKMEMADLERLDAADQDWIVKWRALQGAILHHIYEEEAGWFLEIRQHYADQAYLTERFLEEFRRYAPAGVRDAWKAP